MSLVRFNTDLIFDVDSIEYEILIDSVLAIKDVPGALVEIGTRKGGSTKYIIDALAQNSDTQRELFCIDPYGDIDYDCTRFYHAYDTGPSNEDFPHFYRRHDEKAKEKLRSETFKKNYDFNNSMRNRIVPALYYIAFEAGINFQFFFLEDTEFFSRYSDGVPCYDNRQKKLVDKYAFVFFDGPHTNEIVKREAEFFIPRTSLGGILLFDDHWMYDHDKLIEPMLFSAGFELVDKKIVKASYRKIK